MKKVFTFGLLTLMIFAGFMLTSCDNLSNYKREAKEVISSYANFEEYSLENWSKILGIVDESKVAIDIAAKRSEVDSIVLMTKRDINDIQKENESMLDQVKQSYVEIFLLAEHPEATISNVIVTEYLGIYENSIVVVLNDSYHKYFIEVEIELIIEGLNFTYSAGYPIRVWNNGNIYELEEAYNSGLLSLEHLQIIENLYHNPSELKVF